MVREIVAGYGTGRQGSVSSAQESWSLHAIWAIHDNVSDGECA